MLTEQVKAVSAFNKIPKSIKQKAVRIFPLPLYALHSAIVPIEGYCST